MISALVPFLLVLSGWPTTIFIATLALWFMKEPLQIACQPDADLNHALSLTARLFFIYTIIFCVAIYAHLFL
jgi:CDP-diglyceride synthetase